MCFENAKKAMPVAGWEPLKYKVPALDRWAQGRTDSSHGSKTLAGNQGLWHRLHSDLFFGRIKFP